MSEGMMVAIIDDDEAVLDSLRMMLTRYGFEVRLFKSAEDYFAAGDQETPCCRGPSLATFFLSLGAAAP